MPASTSRQAAAWTGLSSARQPASASRQWASAREVALLAGEQRQVPLPDS
jgi:hypothetical protein